MGIWARSSLVQLVEWRGETPRPIELNMKIKILATGKIVDVGDKKAAQFLDSGLGEIVAPKPKAKRVRKTTVK